MKNPTMIQLNLIQFTNQSPNHVAMTTIVSTSQCESRIIDSKTYLEYASSETKVTVTNYGFLHIYKLTTSLASAAKSFPLQ